MDSEWFRTFGKEGGLGGGLYGPSLHAMLGPDIHSLLGMFGHAIEALEGAEGKGWEIKGNVGGLEGPLGFFGRAFFGGGREQDRDERQGQRRKEPHGGNTEGYIEGPFTEV